MNTKKIIAKVKNNLIAKRYASEDETKKVKDYKEMLEILDAEGVSRKPAYTGYGLEVYQDNTKKIQIIVNFRGGSKTVTINRGF